MCLELPTGHSWDKNHDNYVRRATREHPVSKGVVLKCAGIDVWVTKA